MKNLGAISDPKDIITKEYLDEGIGKTVNTLEDNIAMAESDIESLQTDVGTLQTDNTATKAAVKTLQDTYVPNTRKVNGKALDVDIELTAFDVGTQPAEWEWKGDRAYGLVIGTGSGHDVEIGQMTVETTEDSYVAYYYGRYVDNSYIKTSFDSASSYRAVEVSIEPTTDMGIVNKKFLETQLANISIPTKTSQLTNDSGFLTSAPVTSVNSKTGAVELTASDINALPTSGGILTGNLKVGLADIGTNGYVQGTWLQGTANNHMTSEATKVAVQDANGWVYHRTPEELRTDMGAAKTLTYSVQTKTSWTNSSGYYQQTITVSGILSTDSPIIDIIPSLSNYASELEAWNKVIKITTNSNSITIFSSEAISIALTLNIKVVR